MVLHTFFSVLLLLCLSVLVGVSYFVCCRWDWVDASHNNNYSPYSTVMHNSHVYTLTLKSCSVCVGMCLAWFISVLCTIGHHEQALRHLNFERMCCSVRANVWSAGVSAVSGWGLWGFCHGLGFPNWTAAPWMLAVAWCGVCTASRAHKTPAQEWQMRNTQPHCSHPANVTLLAQKLASTLICLHNSDLQTPLLPLNEVCYGSSGSPADPQLTEH